MDADLPDPLRRRVSAAHRLTRRVGPGAAPCRGVASARPLQRGEPTPGPPACPLPTAHGSRSQQPLEGRAVATRKAGPAAQAAFQTAASNPWGLRSAVPPSRPVDPRGCTPLRRRAAL